jgi:Fe2+ transport system protein FeoA
MGMKTLINAQKSEKLRITAIVGGRGVQRHLAQLGIGIGSVIKVNRNALFSGPVIIGHDGSNYAIGKGIAAKIEVEVIK